MEHKINTINNFYGTNQFFIKDDPQGYQSMYNLKNVENIIIIKNTITIKFDNGKSIREEFETEELAREMLMYIVMAISEGARLIGRAIYEHNKAVMNERKEAEE